MSADLHGDHYARGAAHDFAVNVVAGARPPWLQDAIARGVAALGAYPDEAPAVAAVAARHGRAVEDVVLVNGSAQAFTLVAHALRPRRPTVVHPSFTEPERALRESGAAPARAILAAPFALDPSAVGDDADLVVVGNPTNPTGVLHPRAAIADLCRPGRVTVVDEAFMDLVPGERESVAGAELPGLVVTRSVTKALGVPGVRAGYLLAPAPVAAALRRARPAWSLNAVALAVLEAAARHPEHTAQLALRTAEERARLAARLRDVPGVAVLDGAANFLLLEVRDGARVAERLREEHGIAVRPAATFPGLGPDHLRVAVRGDPLDAQLVAALGAVGSVPVG
ncbi:MAG: histidinol-phosphate aminotransferase [Solirubrobacteraceae bacterium]|nr:histidinol-phosphate aminotransferase [Solirubrobacteraceae bacterium]